VVIREGAFIKEALLASGIKERSKIAFYVDKLNHLQKQFMCEMTPPPDPVLKARALFNWLWIKKPGRYKSHGSYRLSDVIDAQLSKGSQTVGNCLGLTLLYDCLLRKMGVNAQALYLENAFGVGPHVLTLLKTKEFTIDIENILRDGFDYKGHLNNPSRTQWGDRELVADIYHSLGNEFFKKDEFVEALKNYNMAINLNPQYEKARLNKAILLDKMGREEKQAKNGS